SIGPLGRRQHPIVRKCSSRGRSGATPVPAHRTMTPPIQRVGGIMKRATVIGLGQMGSTLARLLLDSGYRVTVWNRTAAKAEPLVARGAELAPTALAAVSASRVVVVCVHDYA